MSVPGRKRDDHRGAATATEPFRFALRVYYEDTDAAGVVYYANYLKFMERARTEWLAALGFPLAAFEREHGVVFVVHRCEIDFLHPARLNDSLAATVEVEDRGAVRLTVRQKVLRDERVLTSARVTLACVDARALRPVRMPAPLVERLENSA
jgi:acyl-CoA thioester hydrolase